MRETEESESYAMPRVGYKAGIRRTFYIAIAIAITRGTKQEESQHEKRNAKSATSKTEKVADLYEYQLAGAVGGASLIEDGWRRHGLIEREIAESVVVTNINCRARMQKVRQQNVGSELFCWRKRPSGVTSKICLQIQELLVGERSVVIENKAKR